jgi:hypothetical protein
MNQQRIIHVSPWPEWYATQDTSRGVWLCDRTSDQKVLAQPPTEWGRDWKWNVTEDGKGVCLRQERKPLAPETKVFNRMDGESGTILNRFGPHEYEVMTDEGIEVWREEDIQVVEEG